MMIFILTCTGNISIKEEGDIKKETCISIPGSDGWRYEGQLVTHDGMLYVLEGKSNI